MVIFLLAISKYSGIICIMKVVSPFKNIAIAGVGLMGGSLGLGLKKYTRGVCITGIGRNLYRLSLAKKLGAIDRISLKLSAGVADQDLVILAQPVETIKKSLAMIAPFLKDGAVVMDVGGTKESICREARKRLPPAVHFIATHPLAGSEKTGVGFASADLFRGAKCILIKNRSRKGRKAFKKIALVFKILGGEGITMTAREHDERMSAISHLPHLAAQALVGVVAGSNPKALRLAASGFRDTTRIAQSSPELWRDIFIDNKKNIIWHLNSYEKELKKLRSLIAKPRPDRLFAYLNNVSKIRKTIS